MGSIPSERRFKADSVCIIGAGPSGLAAAKYLIAEKAFSKIVIYEQRSKTGGLWNYLPCNEGSAKVPVPQTNPHAGHAEPVWGQVGHDGNVSEEPDFVSPVYERLETNIPRGLMGFSDLDWDQDRQLFPKHEDVLNYLQTYGKDVSHLIKFRTQVLHVRLRPDEKWTVTTAPISQSNSPQEPTQETFDAVICANGHYEVPYIPQVPGISTFHKNHPNIISHSKFYRKPEAYTNKKVIIVGNSASGIDIGSQIERVCKLPLIISQKSESYLNVEGSKPSQISKPEIISYIPSNRTVKFSDGTIEKDIDHVVYCTGYFYSYPFLESLDPPIITTGERVQNTYQHLFYAPQPTLSFLVLNQKVIPFPMAEVQSAVIARVLSGRLTLPSLHEMKAWEEGVEKEMGTGRNFHVLKFPKDAEQINALSDWARSADGEEGDDVGIGKKPPRWGEKEFYTRERFPNIKSAFNALGEGRYQVRRLEEVGFDFEKWRAEEEGKRE
ncbi:hypothetical protein CKM354_001266200 [Cercospora kikuchii]|uniref:Thiol-specific monooxygenase n=1 Tax=Cercospora kikuchii TaxID=84275 RepID=A0A9P3L247_9PEZI|nr:uncharacterized protein CKM354_001266200 [Cercospora kikuchii]GIZ49633.1 hypothetical protein CKM354_001266200 [Cercospora kikuchii]